LYIARFPKVKRKRQARGKRSDAARRMAEGRFPK
jgi:uncharacterized protein HemY